MAIARVQEISAAGTATGTFFPGATFNAPTQAGNLLIALVTTQPSALPVETIPATGFISAINNTNADGAGTYLFYYPNAVSLSTVGFKCTLIGSHSWTIFIAEYQGILQSSPLDQTGSGQSASGTIPTGSISTTSAYELIIAGCSDLAGDTFSAPTNGFTLLDQQAIGSGGTLQAGGYLELIVTSTGTYSSAITNTGSTGGNGIIASFKGIPGTVPPYNSIFFASGL
jgi:hypothetical protein